MAVYIINRSVNANSGKSTPEEIWSGNKINLSHIKLFGSQVMVHIPKQKRKKWDFKSEKLIFVGYDAHSKGFRCMNPKKRKLTISRDVKFHEDNSTSKIQVLEMNELDLDEVREENSLVNIKSDDEEEPITPQITEEQFDTPLNSPERPDNTLVEHSPESPGIDDPNDPEYVPEEDVRINASYQPRRTRNASRFHNMANLAYEVDFDFALQCDENSHMEDPIDSRELCKRNDFEKWQAAMQDKMNPLLENNTWTLVNLPPGRKTVKSKWIFKTKRNNNGDIIRHKARLVANRDVHGYHF